MPRPAEKLAGSLFKGDIEFPASDRAEKIRDVFLDAIRSEGLSPEPLVDVAASASGAVRDLFAGLGRAGREVYLIRDVALINVHIRSEPPGWWNILKTVKRDLDFMASEFGLNCLYVLLIGSGNRHVADGYIVSDFGKPPFIRAPKAEATKFTINERQHLDKRALLLSVKRVANVLAQHRKARAGTPESIHRTAKGRR